MRTVRTVVRQSDGAAAFLPLGEVWSVSGVLADTFPLDRNLARGPRVARRAAHWLRLVLVDKAITDVDRSVMLTVSRTPWVPAIAAAVLAAAVAPKLPRRLWVLSLAALAAWALHGGRAARYVAMRRELGRVAPGAIIVADFVTLKPGAPVDWVRRVLELDDRRPYVGLVPVSGDERRDAARVRLYTRRLGARLAGRTSAAGQDVMVLVRD